MRGGTPGRQRRCSGGARRKQEAGLRESSDSSERQRTPSDPRDRQTGSSQEPVINEVQLETIAKWSHIPGFNGQSYCATGWHSGRRRRQIVWESALEERKRHTDSDMDATGDGQP
ncbi:hypothetical protein NDU88_008151 [Pleurodeles waltl]|uniref:Uncharacterized protein n=1 Tax=Pleurodeles waltl TaxID=8319 RepID=A0AAV7P2U0_PLEWA|nr:hypothetical protein NDU88_008151 [Pleurodeles waltl]